MALAAVLVTCFLRLGLHRLRAPLNPLERALWLQSACRGVLNAVGVSTCVIGERPLTGLVVSNHLSYLDIAVYSAVMPCVFVSKAEVRKWPYFGLAARAGGTIFLDRSSRASAGVAAAEIWNSLKVPVPVLLFPEGTSTDGSEVLRFHTSLFQPAIEMRAPVTAAAVQYICDAGVPEKELCWYGDAEFVPHLWKLLAAPDFTAAVTFGESAVYPDRREAAEATREIVAGMRAEAAAGMALYA